MSTGWTVQQIDATPWPDMVDLLRYLKLNPPMYLQYKWVHFEADKGKKPTEEELFSAIEGLRGETPSPMNWPKFVPPVPKE
jgi:hypothetical protein